MKLEVSLSIAKVTKHQYYYKPKKGKPGAKPSLSTFFIDSNENKFSVLNTQVVGAAGTIEVSTITITSGDYNDITTGIVHANDSDIGTPILAQTTSPSFIWSDVSASGHTVGTLDWYNDFLVKNLPLDTANLQ